MGNGSGPLASRNTWRLIGAALVVVVVVLALRSLPLDTFAEGIQDWVERLGVWGPIAFTGLYVVLSLLLPASLLTLAAGAMYGLLLGTLVVSVASTTAAALAFLIGRYLARDPVRRRIEQSAKLAAVDRAIGEQGWKIVALLRLSPGVPFNLQNYLCGVTTIRFWPYVATSWAAMLPGTFLYVYLGSLGRTAMGGETTTGEWVLRVVGAIATIAVSVYIARLAQRAIRESTGDGKKNTAGEN